jgi:hypothetical protein
VKRATVIGLCIIGAPFLVAGFLISVAWTWCSLGWLVHMDLLDRLRARR